MAKFQKGHTKLGGRKAGTPNKISLDVRAKLSEMGCDPIEGLARVGMATEKDSPAIAARCYGELANYVHAKRRAVELTGPDGSAIEVNANSSALQALEDRIDGIAQRLGAKTVAVNP